MQTVSDSPLSPYIVRSCRYILYYSSATHSANQFYPLSYLFSSALHLLIGSLFGGRSVIPIVWSLVGFTAAIKLGIYQDIGLLIAGNLSAIILFTKK